MAELSNRQLVLVALLLSGGAERFVDLETITVRAYELSPTRFRWEKFEYPSLEAVRVGFKQWLALGKREAPRVVARRREYRLTAAGIHDAVEVAARLANRPFSDPTSVVLNFTSGKEVAQSGLERSVTRSRSSQTKLRQLRRHAVFRKWREHDTQDPERWEVAEALQCLPDSAPRVWTDRLRDLESLAEWWQDDEIAEFLHYLRPRVEAIVGTLRSV